MMFLVIRQKTSAKSCVVLLLRKECQVAGMFYRYNAGGTSLISNSDAQHHVKRIYLVDIAVQVIVVVVGPI